MRKGLFASSTALNQLKLMCNMLGRPDEASWFRGRRGDMSSRHGLLVGGKGGMCFANV